MITQLYKVIIFLCILSIVSTVSADDPILLPPVKNDEDKLKVLMSIHEQIPELFSDAARYDINLFQILDEQEELQELLRKNPKYMKLWNERKFLDLSFEIKDDNAKAIETKQVKASAVDLWKQNLKEVLGKYQEKKLELEILERLNNAKNYSSGGFLNGLVLNLPKDLQLKFREMQKVGTQTQDELIQYLRQNLPDFLPQFKAQGIEANPKRDDLIKKLLEIRKIENELGPLMDAYILMSGQNVDARELLNNIDNLTRQDLVNLSDPDYQKPAFLKLTKNKDTRIPNAYLKYLQNFLSQTETIKSEMASGYQVRIKEQNPHVAIFRGCTGGDCSSQYSFPYPNDPNERVFFIYDKENRLKGYVSATVVEDAKKNKRLYVITIAGNRVNAQDTELILQGLDAKKESLGVSKIILPEKKNLDNLLNFAPIKDVFHQAVGSRPPEDIYYQDKKIRLQIQAYESVNNAGEYDHIANNTKGVEYVPLNKINIRTQMTQVPPQMRSLVIKNSFEPTAVIEFCLALDGSHREDFIDDTLDIAMSNPQKKKAAKRLMKIVTKKPVMTTDRLINEIEQLVAILEISPDRFSEKKEQWLINNLLNASDGLKEKNLSKNLDLIAWDFKNNNPPLIEGEIFKKYEKVFVNHKSYLKLQNTFLKKLKDDPFFVEELERNDPRMRLAFSTDVADDQLPSGKTIVLLQEYIATLSDYGQKLVVENIYYAGTRSAVDSLVKKLNIKNQENLYKNFIEKGIELKQSEPYLSYIVDALSQPHTKDMIDVYKSLIEAMVKLKDWDVIKSFVEEVLSQPHTKDMLDVYKLFFKKMPKDWLTDILMVFLKKVLTQDHAKNMVGIKELIFSKIVESKNEDLLNVFVKEALSKPEWINVEHMHKQFLNKVVEMKSKDLLRSYAANVLSKPHTKDMIEVYKLYIEKAAEMKDPYSFSHLIIYSLSKEHTRDMTEVYQLLVEKAIDLEDYRMFKILSENVLTAPHTQKDPFFDSLRKFCKKVNNKFSTAGRSAVKKMIENEFEHLQKVNSGKKASVIQQCLSEGLK